MSFKLVLKRLNIVTPDARNEPSWFAIRPVSIPDLQRTTVFHAEELTSSTEVKSENQICVLGDLRGLNNRNDFLNL